MTEPGGWTTPDGWGPPAPPPPPPGGAPGYGQPQYGQPQYGQPQYGQPPHGYRPEVKPGVVPLRPLGLSAAVAVVSTLAGVLLLLTAFRPFAELDPAALESGSTDALEAAVGGAAVGGLLTGLLALLASAVLTGVLTAVVGRAVLGQPLSLGEAWEQVRPVLLKLIGVAFTLVLLAAGLALVGVVGAVLLIAAGGAAAALIGVPLALAGVLAAVYVAVRLSLAPCAVVLERVGVRAGLRRSWLLVKGDWWRVFGISLLTLVVASFVSLVIQVPFELIGYGSLSGLTSGTDALAARTLIASSIGSVIAATLVEPFTAGVRALLYVDRRIRAEGLDVALTAAANAQP